MAAFLIHMTCGPSDQTKSALGFLVAKAAIEEGHRVALFLAGDAVVLLKDDVLASVTGVGTGRLQEHFDFLVQNGARFFLSAMSSKPREVTDADLQGKPAEFAKPTQLVRLAAEADTVITY